MASDVGHSHPVCEACGEEFATVEQLSTWITCTGRNDYFLEGLRRKSLTTSGSASA
jgi:hypothetical protein